MADAYPHARLAALAGDPARLNELRSEIDARFASIDGWLNEAAESEDE